MTIVWGVIPLLSEYVCTTIQMIYYSTYLHVYHECSKLAMYETTYRTDTAKPSRFPLGIVDSLTPPLSFLSSPTRNSPLPLFLYPLPLPRQPTPDPDLPQIFGRRARDQLILSMVTAHTIRTWYYRACMIVPLQCGVRPTHQLEHSHSPGCLTILAYLSGFPLFLILLSGLFDELWHP